jgi:seryl-tRNA synthetase
MCGVRLTAHGAGASAFVGSGSAPGRSFAGLTHPRALRSSPLTRAGRRPGVARRCAAATTPSRRRQAPVCALAVDLRFVRDNAALVAKNAADRAVAVDVPLIVALYDEVASRASEVRDLRTERNEIAERMKGAAKMQKEERDRCVARGKEVKDAVMNAEVALDAAEKALEDEASKLPNMSHQNVPIGSEENAALLSVVGQKRDFAAEGMEVTGHLDTAIALDMVDFENAARVSGAKFYYMRNAGALLELALVNWAMSTAAAAGFTVMTTPDVARESVVAGCGFQPRGESSQVYRIQDSDLCLVGTAEITLGGYYAGQILDKQQLPIKMAAFSHCFRREVGAAGLTTRGLYRVHQFSKVEMFVIGHPDDSERLHAELREMEEAMYASLGLHFRVLDMPTHDLGAPAQRKFDIEAWMPGRGSFGEISSASNCTDYQARRLNIRYREGQGDNRFVHTLNATACAVPRMIVSILENNVQADGSVIIPEPLRPFMGGMTHIRPKSTALHASTVSGR